MTRIPVVIVFPRLRLSGDTWFRIGRLDLSGCRGVACDARDDTDASASRFTARLMGHWDLARTHPTARFSSGSRGRRKRRPYGFLPNDTIRARTDRPVGAVVMNSGAFSSACQSEETLRRSAAGWTATATEADSGCFFFLDASSSSPLPPPYPSTSTVKTEAGSLALAAALADASSPRMRRRKRRRTWCSPPRRRRRSARPPRARPETGLAALDIVCAEHDVSAAMSSARRRNGCRGNRRRRVDRPHRGDQGRGGSSPAVVPASSTPMPELRFGVLARSG